MTFKKLFFAINESSGQWNSRAIVAAEIRFSASKINPKILFLLIT